MQNISGIRAAGQQPQGYPPPEQQEAAIILTGLREMQNADPEKIVYEDPESGQQFSERDYVASVVAARMNEIPMYQEKFGIGGTTGRKVVGFTPLINEENRERIPPEVAASLPKDALVPIIENIHTKSTGPMTKRASTDQDDEVEYISLSNLARMAGEQG